MSRSKNTTGSKPSVEFQGRRAGANKRYTGTSGKAAKQKAHTLERLEDKRIEREEGEEASK